MVGRTTQYRAELYRALPSASAPAPAVAGVRAAPDQHERHADLLALKAERAALDQYERHADRFVPKAEGAALDQYEHHRYGFVSSAAPHDLSWPRRRVVFTATAAAAISAALDQHERHQGAYVPAATPLDQHERHPDGLPTDMYAPKAENAALPDALDRYLASRNRP